MSNSNRNWIERDGRVYWTLSSMVLIKLPQRWNLLTYPFSQWSKPSAALLSLSSGAIPRVLHLYSRG